MARLGLALTLALAIGGAAGAQAPLATWESLVGLPGVTDLAGPRRDGSFMATANGRLFLLDPGGALRDFARGVTGYATAVGPETYVALARRWRVRGAHCAFRRDDLYALEVTVPGVVTVDPNGVARPFASLPDGVFPNGIAFDDVGRFGHRLLVNAAFAGGANVYALDCRGHAQVIAEGAPAMEGGIAVAPRGFGRFAGQLIAPDELSGRILAIDRRGVAQTVVVSGLASGPDVGVESAGFVPHGFGRRGAAYLADRGTPGNPHPGTDSVLVLRGEAIVAAGVRPGDLIVAGEGGAETIAVHCRRVCTVRRIAVGSPAAHAEGHIVFALAG